MEPIENIKDGDKETQELDEISLEENIKKDHDRDLEEGMDELENSISKNRQRWITISRLLTFYIPDCLLSCWIYNDEKKQAWREKIAIFTLMILFSLCFLAIYIVVPIVSCQQPKMYRWTEIEDPKNKNQWMVLNGYILDVKKLIPVHNTPKRVLASYLGQDVSEFFEGLPQDKIPSICQFINASTYPDYINGSCTVPKTNETYCHPYMYPPNSIYYYGKLAYTWGDLAELKHEQHWTVINNKVYNTTRYFAGDFNFLGDDFNKVIKNRDKTDGTDLYYNIFLNDDYLECLDVLFYAGVMDTRSYTTCFAVNTALFSLLIVIATIVLVKFLAAMFTIGTVHYKLRKKYVIVNIPCYSENYESMYKTIISATSMIYPHKYQLLFIVCDGMVTGKGNDRSTPEIVLDILERKLEDCPDSYEYDSLQGPNRCKVYTGFYRDVVPYMVVVKCGMESESNKPGNRGKRDSQIILLSFLNKVFSKNTRKPKEFSPLDKKIYADLTDIIKVDPNNYEYIKTIDADTQVDKHALANMVYRMDSDKDIIALCGETRVKNRWDSWVTVIQVYEYYVNHHLNKAYESLFGSVTCLPGCFSIYRIKSFPKTGHKRMKPYIIDDDIITSYANRNVNSLHTKNLLSLGEDRFFTTLLLRFFPDKKIKYIHEAVCTTIVPNKWSVLLSQRRRWINSTIHNLIELMSIRTLRGVACFSIKTVILMDLISTFLLPVSILYLGYLIWDLTTNNLPFPLILIVSISVMIGSQICIIILKQDWAYLFWFLLYLLAIPIWYIIFPIYSIYHMDEFSWGSTRQVETKYISTKDPPLRGTEKHVQIKVQPELPSPSEVHIVLPQPEPDHKLLHVEKSKDKERYKPRDSSRGRNRPRDNSKERDRPRDRSRDRDSSVTRSRDRDSSVTRSRDRDSSITRSRERDSSITK